MTSVAADTRDALRADLVAAMKARAPIVVAAIRSMIAAIDNAGAIADVPDIAWSDFDAMRVGAGFAEADRRELKRR